MARNELEPEVTEVLLKLFESVSDQGGGIIDLPDSVRELVRQKRAMTPERKVRIEAMTVREIAAEKELLMREVGYDSQVDGLTPPTGVKSTELYRWFQAVEELDHLNETLQRRLTIDPLESEEEPGDREEDYPPDYSDEAFRRGITLAELEDERAERRRENEGE